MIIYDYSGNMLNPQNSMYDVNGVVPKYAYDIHGNIIADSGIIPHTKNTFVIMSYNVGSWYGYGNNVPSNLANSYYAMQKTIFDKYNPDFVGIQEYYSAIGSYRAQDLVMWTDPYFYGVDKISGTAAGRAFASKYPLRDCTDNLFLNQDGGEPRYYLKGYITFNSKSICVISAHTSYSGIYPYTQCNELLDVIENEEYFIVVGDMNLQVNELDNANYNKLNAVWEQAGYNSASGHQFGIQKTFWRSSDGWSGLDQIFTSPNITLKEVIVDDTKTNSHASLVGTNIDHCPLVAIAEIN